MTKQQRPLLWIQFAVRKERSLRVLFLMAGTSDARELGVHLRDMGYPVIASVVTESAAQSLREVGLSVRVGRLDAISMEQEIKKYNAEAVVDASHPFAREAHETAMATAQRLGVPYLRYERAGLDFSGRQGIILADSYEQAADYAAELKGSVMLTTGAKTLGIFAHRLLPIEDVRLVIRLLPRLENMQLCEQLGIAQKNIIAMQGPFSYELNQALYRHYQTTVMITKESGEVGAVDEKIQAAVDLGISIIVIGRPNVEYGNSYSSVDEITTALQKIKGVSGDLNRKTDKEAYDVASE